MKRFYNLKATFGSEECLLYPHKYKKKLRLNLPSGFSLIGLSSSAKKSVASQALSVESKYRTEKQNTFILKPKWFNLIN